MVEVHKHHPHHSLSSFSFWDEDWSRYKRFYGFTDLRGRPARRGRDGRGSRNQVVAGILHAVFGYAVDTLAWTVMVVVCPGPIVRSYF